MLEAFGDTEPWEQLMLLTTPLEDFGVEGETLLQLLARKPNQDLLRQAIALVSSWAA